MAGGPGNYIYALGAADFMSERVKVNKNIRFTIDILPHVGDALKKAQSEGFMVGTTALPPFTIPPKTPWS